MEIGDAILEETQRNMQAEDVEAEIVEIKSKS